MTTLRHVGRIFLLSAVFFPCFFNKPALANSAELTQGGSGDTDSNPKNVSFDITLTAFMTKLMPIEPAQRMNQFYDFSYQVPEKAALSFDFDTETSATGAFVNRRTAILVNPLVVDGKLTANASIYKNTIALLLISKTFLPDFNTAYPKQMPAFPPDVQTWSKGDIKRWNKTKEWAQKWLSDFGIENQTRVGKEANDLFRRLQPLGIEERARLLCDFAGQVSPEAGRAYAQYYAPETVKKFADVIVAQNNAVKDNAVVKPEIQPNNAMPHPVEVEYSKTAFDPSMKKLPVNFKGNDIVNLIDSIDKATPRGEFEKMDDYCQRIATAAGLEGEFNSKSLFSYCKNLQGINPHYIPQYLIKYDIDKEKMSISFAWVEQDSIDLGYKTIEEDRSGEHYRIRITNASEQYNYSEGVQRNYKEGHWGTLYSIENHLQDVNVDMSPEEAKTTKEDLNILVIFQMASDTTHVHHDLNVNVRKFLIFNSKTGEYWECPARD